MYLETGTEFAKKLWAVQILLFTFR